MVKPCRSPCSSPTRSALGEIAGEITGFPGAAIPPCRMAATWVSTSLAVTMMPVITVKFVLPGASTLTLLAWYRNEHADGYQASGQKPHLLNACVGARTGSSRPIRALTAFYGQVGNGVEDHKYWAPPETMTMVRPSYKVDTTKTRHRSRRRSRRLARRRRDPLQNRGPRLLRETATHARQPLTSRIPTVAPTRPHPRCPGVLQLLLPATTMSWSGLRPGFTGPPARAPTSPRPSRSTTNTRRRQPEVDPRLGRQNQRYHRAARSSSPARAQTRRQRRTGPISDGRLQRQQKSATTPRGGLAWLDRRGSLRYAANTSLPRIYLRGQSGRRRHAVSRFARRQINDMLAEKPNNRSYVVGFGNNPPINFHHRDAHGSWVNDQYNP